MVKFGTIPGKAILGVRGDCSLGGGGQQAPAPAGGELRACVVCLPVVLSAKWPEN